MQAPLAKPGAEVGEPAPRREGARVVEHLLDAQIDELFQLIQVVVDRPHRPGRKHAGPGAEGAPAAAATRPAGHAPPPPAVGAGRAGGPAIGAFLEEVPVAIGVELPLRQLAVDVRPHGLAHRRVGLFAGVDDLGLVVTPEHAAPEVVAPLQEVGEIQYGEVELAAPNHVVDGAEEERLFGKRGDVVADERDGHCRKPRLEVGDGLVERWGAGRLGLNHHQVGPGRARSPGSRFPSPSLRRSRPAKRPRGHAAAAAWPPTPATPER